MAINILTRPSKFSSVGGNTPNAIVYEFQRTALEQSVTVEIKDGAGLVFATIRQSFVGSTIFVDISRILQAKVNIVLDTTNDVDITEGANIFEYYINADSANKRYAILANENNFVGDLAPYIVNSTSFEDASFLQVFEQIQNVKGLKNVVSFIADESLANLNGVQLIQEFLGINQNFISDKVEQLTITQNGVLHLPIEQSPPDGTKYIDVYLQEGMPPVPLLLDIYGAASAAYSLRKLAINYNGAAVRVRRSIDNSELDIGFDGINFDVTTFISFIGVGVGFVVTWYDQSGNNKDINKSTEIEQPQISVASIGGRSSIIFDGVDDFLNGDIGVLPNTSFGFFTVSRIGAAVGNLLAVMSSGGLAVSGGTSGIRWKLGLGFDPSFIIQGLGWGGFGAEASFGTDLGLTPNTDYTSTGLYDGAVWNRYNNGVLVGASPIADTSQPTSNFQLHVGNEQSTYFWDDHIAEVIVYNFNKNTERIGIEANQSNYYGI